MYKIVSKLLMYGDMPKDSILMQLSDIFKQMDQDTQSRDEPVSYTHLPCLNDGTNKGFAGQHDDICQDFNIYAESQNDTSYQ